MPRTMHGGGYMTCSNRRDEGNAYRERNRASHWKTTTTKAGGSSGIEYRSRMPALFHVSIYIQSTC